jgi:glycosyltransferase involved in cell wall biosynthesis
MKKKVLHITVHIGGGIGKALSGILSYEKFDNSNFEHKLLILEQPEKSQFVDICQANGIEIIFTSNLNAISLEMENADITVIHWWHHPLTAWLFANFPKIETRLILWSHINGCTYPMLPFKLVEKTHKTFFTSRYTMFNPYWEAHEQDFAQKHARVIYGLGQLEDLPFDYSFKKGDEFTIGYVGTLNFSKLNPDFVEYCNEVVKLIPNVKFKMVGNPDEKEKILKQASSLGIQDKFDFVGYTNDVNEVLKTFDVFGYPLNNWHFGTTENAILEAMNATIPVVALNQCSERYLIKHNETGFLANDKKHYAEIMKYLHDNLANRIRISTNAKKMINEEFLMHKNIRNMRDSYAKVYSLDKRIFDFKPIIGTQPYQWFLNFLGTDKEIFENSFQNKCAETEDKIKNCRDILKSKSKSSINHFATYFPEDEVLQYWNELLKEEKVLR